MTPKSEYDQYTEGSLRQEEGYNEAIRAYYAREKSAALRIPAWVFIAAGAAVALAVGYVVLVWIGVL
jgi:hypothetical protein